MNRPMARGVTFYSLSICSMAPSDMAMETIRPDCSSLVTLSGLVKLTMKPMMEEAHKVPSMRAMFSNCLELNFMPAHLSCK